MTKSDPLEFIRRSYGVPAQLGGRVVYEAYHDGPIEGEIVGTYGSHLLVQLADPSRRIPIPLHPVHNLRYLASELEAAPQLDLFGNPIPREGS